MRSLQLNIVVTGLIAQPPVLGYVIERALSSPNGKE
jgi:hypothetical protein